MDPGATILALSSPPGRGARAIIRLSGPAVPVITGRFFESSLAPGAHTAVLVLPGGGRLPVLAFRFSAPRSYTGDDLLEIQFPGNPHLVERLSALFLADPSVRRAGPGEFTARAFLNGKLSLDQAEGIALAIAAEAESDLAAANRLTSGQTGSLYRRWSDELANLLALVEAGIDFTDQEDVVPIPPRDLRARLDALAGDMASRLGAGRVRESRGELPFIALVGAPNAGKSTLFNALLGRRRAVTSPIAGTTRDALAEPLDLSRDAAGAGTVMLTDIAGLETARARGGVPAGARAAHSSDQGELSPDLQAQTQAARTLARADILLYCDPAGRFPPLPPTSADIIRVRTKSDLSAASPSPAVIPVCALDGRNLGRLRRAIASAVRGSSAGADAILAPRHRAAVAVAAERLGEAARAVDPAARALASPELTGGLLREALDALGTLTGRIPPDEILGRVFATFCIGK